MTQDNITYGVAAAVGTDFLTDWSARLPDITLQNAMYVVTIAWILYQFWRKLKGKD